MTRKEVPPSSSLLDAYEELGQLPCWLSRSAGVAPAVSYMPIPSSNKAAYFGFETQRACHNKSQSTCVKIDASGQKNFFFKFLG